MKRQQSQAIFAVALSILLAGCSLIFSVAEADVSGADSGVVLLDDGAISVVVDSSVANDGGTMANGNDSGSPVDASGEPAVDATEQVCDPFTEPTCYVNNDPLSGPDFYTTGSIEECGSGCSQSSDCAPGLFCNPGGRCFALCDSTNLCPDFSCNSIGYQDFGVCFTNCI